MACSCIISQNQDDYATETTVYSLSVNCNTTDLTERTIKSLISSGLNLFHPKTRLRASLGPPLCAFIPTCVVAQLESGGAAWKETDPLHLCVNLIFNSCTLLLLCSCVHAFPGESWVAHGGERNKVMFCSRGLWRIWGSININMPYYPHRGCFLLWWLGVPFVTPFDSCRKQLKCLDRQHRKHFNLPANAANAVLFMRAPMHGESSRFFFRSPDRKLACCVAVGAPIFLLNVGRFGR